MTVHNCTFVDTGTGPSPILSRSQLLAHADRMLEVNYPRLTAREIQVAKGMLAGYTDQEMSDRLKIKYKTVKSHLVNVRKKFGVLSRAQFFAVIFSQEERPWK